MCANDRPPRRLVPNADGLKRRTLLERGVALGATGGLLSTVSGAASAHPKPHEIVLKALAHEVEVRITVSGEIEKGRLAGDTDTVQHTNVAISRMYGKHERDSFRFSGDIVEFEVLKGDVQVAIDGKAVTPHELDKPKEKTKKPRHLEIRAQGPTVQYRFDVSGRVEPGPEANLDANDEIHDSKVTGTVAGQGVDNYLFTGHITSFETSSDEVTVLLDGEEVDPDSLGEPNRIEIRAQGPTVQYRFDVSGRVEPGPEANLDAGDEIRDGTVTGVVSGRGFDNYRFTGKITSFEASSGDVTVVVNDELLSPHHFG